MYKLFSEMCNFDRIKTLKPSLFMMQHFELAYEGSVLLIYCFTADFGLQLDDSQLSSTPGKMATRT